MYIMQLLRNDPNFILSAVNFGGNLLCCAVLKGHLNAVKYLVEQGAEVNPDILSDEGFGQPAIMAFKYGYMDIFNYLVFELRQEDTDEHKKSAHFPLIDEDTGFSWIRYFAEEKNHDCLRGLLTYP